jgi:cell division protein FtsQ
LKIVFKILFWVAISFYLIVALGFTSHSKKGIICTEVKVIIEDSLNRMFYTKSDIQSILKKGNIKSLGHPVSEINTRKLEELFKGKSYIRSVDIYTSMDGTLAVRIKQRDPFLRVITAEGKSCYIDKEGYFMPESRNYTHYVMVANGHFSGYNQLMGVECMDSIKNPDNYKEWFDLIYLVKMLNKDDFLKSQIVQIYRNKQGHFELFPRVGAHQIILGDVSDLEEKLENLSILYKEGLAFEGWNKYDKIDLRYKNQVVCTKR